jgi:hypothetical protein
MPGDYTLESMCGRAARDGRRFRQMDERVRVKMHNGVKFARR